MEKSKKIPLLILIIIIIGVIIIVQNPFSETETIAGELQDNENTGLDIGNLAP